MKIKKYAVSLGAGAVAVSGLSAATLATTAAPANAAWDSCDLSVKVNELKAWDAEGRYNVIVFKNSAYGSADLKGVVEQGSTNAKACAEVIGHDDYHWVVFEEGTFTRAGDGGYRNWAFFGTFDRPDDSTVNFSKRF
jgi:hypothetical protein